MITRVMAKFYREVTTASLESGFGVLLDGKLVKTPGRHMLAAPSAPLADAIAEEWRAQTEKVDPVSMPLTGLAYGAIDGVAKHRGQVIDHIVGFGRSDLVCYRADAPPDLVRRQAEAWDSHLQWMQEAYGVKLQTGAGVTYVDQPEGAMLAVEKIVSALADFQLVGLDRGVSLTGSLVLSLAMMARRIDADRAFAAAHIDEDFQAETWGRDAEAEARRAYMRHELDAADRFLRLLGTPQA